MSVSALRRRAVCRGGVVASIAIVAALLVAGPGASPAAAETSAEDCLAGTYFDGDDCVPAPKGSFVASDGATAATPCPEGQYQDEVGQVACKPAPAGSSVPTQGAEGATPCPVGQYQDEPGRSTCKAIPLGSGGTGGRTDGTGSTGVEPCAAGTFRGDAATTSCVPAPPGSFVAAAGAQTATPCPAGRYSASAGATACTPASIGYYVPRPGSTGQLRCVTALEPGLAVCPVPTTAPSGPTGGAPTGDGSLSPQGDACPPGTWSTTGTSRAGSTCTPASPGTFVASEGATAEEPCPPGTYSDRFGATACTPAPVGTFVAGFGAMDPMPCPGASEPGLTSCPEVELVAAPEPVDAPSGRTSVWWWIAGLVLVLAAGGSGFVLLQRRTGALAPVEDPDADVEDGPVPGLDDTGLIGGAEPAGASRRGAPSAPAPWPDASPDVLEWDEALDADLDAGPDDGSSTR